MQSESGKTKQRRKRKRPTQIPLFRHGGKRKGAGRPNHSGAASYKIRPDITARTPLHVTFRLRENLPNLRHKQLFQSLRRAVVKAQAKKIALIHYCILSNHVHLIIETESTQTLEKGMKSLLGTLAKALQRVCGSQKISNELRRRKEPLFFLGRYHVHQLKTPKEVKNALQYVLLNEEKHSPRLAGKLKSSPFSSQYAFRNWGQLVGRLHTTQKHPDCIVTIAPQSWLLRVGWMRVETRRSLV